MREGRIRRPSAALVVASIALFVALGGTAGAVVTAVVPLAKRALTADNAKKLERADAVAAPRAGVEGARAGKHRGGARDREDEQLVARSGRGVRLRGRLRFRPEGDRRRLGRSRRLGHGWDDRPSADGSSWRLYITNADDAPSTQSGTLYAVCLR